MSSKKRIKNSIKKEALKAQDFLKFKIPFACEHCSHYSSSYQRCTLGNLALNHLEEQQLRQYQLSGRMAFCRLLEID